MRGPRGGSSGRVGVIEREMPVDVDAVWAVLADAKRYPRWVLHVTEIGRIDGDWPTPGAAFEYRFQWGPVKLSGRATVLQANAPGHVRVRWRRGLLGVSIADISLRQFSDRTVVRMAEAPEGLFAGLSTSPLVDGTRSANNVTSLDRLERLARADARHAR
jgi:uncharacterized protein YndB with AHSA1/START domain